jgi:UDP-galactose transporter B1
MADTVQRKVNGTAQHTNGVAHHQLDGAVHSIEQKLEEQAEIHARNPQEQKEAGLFTLLMCVGGIYGSL